MSRTEWETAHITLPAAEVAPLKKKLRELNNALYEAVKVEVALLHKACTASTMSAYKKKYDAERARNTRPTTAQNIAQDIISARIWQGIKLKPNTEDIARHIKPLTNKDNTFTCYNESGQAEASIRFNGRLVTWSTGEDNHAVEYSHATEMARAFFAALDRITWTRGTGGFGTGNDEYNQDNREHGGGANYITFHYGPLGEAEKAHSMGLTPAAYKKMMAKPARPTYVTSPWRY